MESSKQDEREGLPENLYNQLIEELADYSHGAWAQWMKYQFSECTVLACGDVIPAELVGRWSRQAQTAYKDLPEEEKASDRAEAQKIFKRVAKVLKNA